MLLLDVLRACLLVSCVRARHACVCVCVVRVFIMIPQPFAALCCKPLAPQGPALGISFVVLGRLDYSWAFLQKERSRGSRKVSVGRVCALSTGILMAPSRPRTGRTFCLRLHLALEDLAVLRVTQAEAAR